MAGHKTVETALTIFNTLNARGLPLRDADIFKSYMYKSKGTQKEKDEFIETWKTLEDECRNLNSEIQSYFNIEMYNLKAIDNDISSVVGLRPFFTSNDRLNHSTLLDDLKTFHELNGVITRSVTPADNDTLHQQTIQLLNILTSYENDLWKYPVYIYYNKYRNEANFSDNFIRFLNKLLVVLTVAWFNVPGINAIKQDIFKLNCAIIRSPLPVFDFSKFDRSDIENSNYAIPHTKIRRVLLKVLAYNCKSNTDNSVLPYGWEVEHILPQKYENSYFANYNANEIKEHISHLGNLVPIEKKLNIQVRDGYFGKKREKYRNSNIAILRELSNHPSTDWGLEEIKSRDEQLKQSLIDLFTCWNDEYERARENHSITSTIE